MIREGNLTKDLPWLSGVPVRIDRVERLFFSSQVEWHVSVITGKSEDNSKRDLYLSLMRECCFSYGYG